jgi:hypothetical protein
LLKGDHHVTQLPRLFACGFERVCAIEDSLTVSVKIAQGIGLNPIGENTEQQMTG